MAIPPETPRKPVDKQYLEGKFDEEWAKTLKNLTPHTTAHPTNPALGHPPGTKTLISVFVGNDGYDLAITYRHVGPTGQRLSERDHSPTGMMIGGEWSSL